MFTSFAVLVPFIFRNNHFPAHYYTFHLAKEYHKLWLQHFDDDVHECTAWSHDVEKVIIYRKDRIKSLTKMVNKGKSEEREAYMRNCVPFDDKDNKGLVKFLVSIPDDFYHYDETHRQKL